MRHANGRANLAAFITVLLAAVAAVILMTAPFLLAVLMGGILAVLANPLYARLRAKRVGPRIAAALTTILVLILCIAPIAGLIYAGVRQGVVIGKTLSETQEFSPRALGRRLFDLEPVRRVIPPEEAKARLRGLVQGSGQKALAAILAATKLIPFFALQLALALLSLYFLLIDGKRAAAWLLKLTTLEEDVQDRIAGAFTDAAISSVMAGLAAAVAQGICIFTAYSVLGVPGAFLAAGVTFVCAWIPVLGSVPASVAAVIYLSLQDEHGRMFAMIAAGVLTSLVDNVVRPMVLKGRDELHPLVGLLAVIGGVNLFGLIGLFAGPILAAILIAMLDIWPEIARKAGIGMDGGG